MERGNAGNHRPFKQPGGQRSQTITRGAEAVNRGTTEEGRADHDAGRRGLHPKAVQRTGRLGGSKMLKPATL
ncbi:hypothetical protein NDU88_001668 [Pleurodeles waltl]|uniref:Uncharacterized protein n=1 Tax=Pleurodeles waltl TaxID=8319 RepID=A0AAV7KQ20_PLEWA|nr:hypothetical protein NDU88_001668 [Pleurodeles waltl]